MKKESLLAYFCLAGICIIWGTTFLVMRIGVMHFPPFLFAAIRQLIAGSLLCGFIILIRRENFPSLNTLRIQAFRGFLDDHVWQRICLLGRGFCTQRFGRYHLFHYARYGYPY
ncbi:MAG: EamA family transporter [Cytophagales bacterium]|nr:EamA family transporter [Cytophagales bacterium]